MTDYPVKWDLSVLLKGDHDQSVDDKLKECLQVYIDFALKWKSNHKYLSDPGILKEALDELEQLSRNYDGSGPTGYYFWLRSHQDQTDPYIKARSNKISELEIKISNEMEFFGNRLSKISADVQKVMLEADVLSPYRHFLKKLFEAAKYILSEPEEKILNLKSQTSFSNWVHMVNEFLSKEEREVLTEGGKKEISSFSAVMSLMKSTKKEVRDGAALAFNDILAKYADTAEHEINNVLLDKKVDDDLRGFTRPDEYRHIEDDIETQTVDALIEAVSSRFDISKTFYTLKAKLMGVPKLAYHERNVPLGSLDKEYDYNSTVKLVNDTFIDLDSDFSEIFMEMVIKGRIDVYPQKGKDSGAFCIHKRILDPTYILLNHTGKINDVTTIGHEMGHAINNVLISRSQKALNFGTTLSTAEVASTFMEDFVFDRLSKDFSEKEKLYLIMEKLNDDISTIFRQVACYMFEQELHKTYREKNYLTKEEIGFLFQKHMQAYMGDAVEQSPGSQNWWIYWSHIRNFFYVYSYAGGLLISKSLQNMVRKNKSDIIKVKSFLSAGLSESPRDTFMKMGIDINDRVFWNKGINQVEDLLKQAQSLVS